MDWQSHTALPRAMYLAWLKTAYIFNNTHEATAQVVSSAVNPGEFDPTKFSTFSIKVQQCLAFSCAVLMPCQDTGSKKDRI